MSSRMSQRHQQPQQHCGHSSSSSKSSAEEEHAEFKRWLRGLDRTQLVSAMECAFHDDGYQTNNSHEFDLLREMVRLQSPPPTPIHPRVGDGTDGRSDAARILKNRIQRPRLFQFFEQRSISFASSPPPGATHGGGRRRSHRDRNGVSSGSSSSSSSASSSAQRKRYDVTATAKCIQPWGDAYHVDMLPERILKHDEILLTYSVVDQCDGILGDPSNSNKGGRTYLSFVCPNCLCQQQQQQPTEILRMLRIASRGYFLSKPHHRKRKVPFFCAPWLDPTNRWFSLPMYLASRFEVALWESFLDSRRTTPLSRDRPWDNVQEKLDHNPEVIWRILQKSLCDTLRRDVLSKDRATTVPKVRNGLLFELLVPTELSRLKLLFFRGHQFTEEVSLEKALKSISASPLIELGTSTNQIRLYLRQRLQMEIRAQMETQLLNALAAEGTSSVQGGSNSSTNGISAARTYATASKRSRKKKSKKKNNNRNNNMRRSAPDISQNGGSGAALQVNRAMSSSTGSPQGGEDYSSEDDSDNSTTTNPTNRASGRPEGEEVRLSFPENGTPFVERNKNIVLCLGTLNDIINDVFRQVGLEVSSDESDSSIGGGKREKQKQQQDKKAAASLNANKASTGSAPHQVQHKPPQQQQRETKPQAMPSNQEFSQYNGDTEEKKSPHLSELNAPYSPQNAGYSPQAQDGDQLEICTPTGSFDTFPSQHCFPPGFFHRPFGSNPWDINNSNADGWGRTNRFPARERSILAEFFLEQERADANRQERIIASSTAASLASSTDKNNEDTISISDKFFISLDNGGAETPASFSDIDIPPNEISSEEFPSLDIYQQKEQMAPLKSEEAETGQIGGTEHGVSAFETVLPERNTVRSEEVPDAKVDAVASKDSQSLSPDAPATPSPRLSPILLSLDDLRDIREGAQTAEKSRKLAEMLPAGVTLTVPASLPNSPVVQSKRRLISSLSREDLRLSTFRDDQDFAPKDKSTVSRSRTYNGGVASYRNVAAKSLKQTAKPSLYDAFPKTPSADVRTAFLQKYDRQADSCARSETAADFLEESHNSASALTYRNVAAKSVKSVSDGSRNMSRFHSERVALPMKQDREADMCARSETAVEQGHEDYQNWHDSRRTNEENPDNMTVGKDGSTTITSAMSHRGESEETSNLREERNTFRDMCLTLGAEVAKLKNQLATQKGAAMYPAIDYSQGYVQPVFGAGSFDPECMPPFFQKGQALGAMSDAGIHRAEYESQVSEDDEAKMSRGDEARRMSTGNTVAESDVSIEYTNTSLALQGPAGLSAPMTKELHDATTVSGLQTRLTQDIMRFLAATEVQHRKLNRTRDAAVERITRLVNTLWPRAQVKLYGSHVTGLCLPSSDLDFVICLPAVHKNAPAVAPGVLEGRNAINESSQKLLARKLKGESWIDPRSMKLIERTVVPVIKVATKDTRARTMQLDISFDSPEHHGLEAIVMVKQIVEELPMIRPLVLVLKQFLLDRGLLTAYTGGLSSYCLFLMVARYLQEQSSWGDCGSLLMGFLDFYGNCFDPRSTGISVGRRQYFTRANYVAAQRQAATQHMWNPIPPTSGPVAIPSPASSSGHPDFFRRNSFTDKGSVDILRGTGTPPLTRPPRFQAPASSRFMMHVPQPAEHVPFEPPMDHAMPFTFDPLFVDDPLSSGNNVGRNAFRIFQVQRAFSDAHRALVASLEWDMGELHDGNEYPLLKCLLQSEDVLYEL